MATARKRAIVILLSIIALGGIGGGALKKLNNDGITVFRPDQTERFLYVGDGIQATTVAVSIATFTDDQIKKAVDEGSDVVQLTTGAYNVPTSLSPDGKLLGEDQGEEIRVFKGRFGPYVQRGAATEETPKPPRQSVPILSISSSMISGFAVLHTLSDCMNFPGKAPMYVRLCPFISASSRIPPPT